MKVLVTGYAGQLGWDTVHQLEARGIEARGVDIQDFSLTDAPAVMACIRDYHPDAIVHWSPSRRSAPMSTAWAP